MTSPDRASTNLRVGDSAVPAFSVPHFAAQEGQRYSSGVDWGVWARYLAGKDFAAAYAEARFHGACQDLQLKSATALRRRPRRGDRRTARARSSTTPPPARRCSAASPMGYTGAYILGRDLRRPRRISPTSGTGRSPGWSAWWRRAPKPRRPAACWNGRRGRSPWNSIGSSARRPSAASPPPPYSCTGEHAWPCSRCSSGDRQRIPPRKFMENWTTSSTRSSA